MTAVDGFVMVISNSHFTSNSASVGQSWMVRKWIMRASSEAVNYHIYLE